MANLTGLPLEALKLVAEEVQADDGDLLALSQVSKLFRDLALPLVYRDVEFGGALGAANAPTQIIDFVSSVAMSDKKAGWVRSLTIGYMPDINAPQHAGLRAQVLTQLTRLGQEARVKKMWDCLTATWTTRRTNVASQDWRLIDCFPFVIAWGISRLSLLRSLKIGGRHGNLWAELQLIYDTQKPSCLRQLRSISVQQAPMGAQPPNPPPAPLDLIFELPRLRSVKIACLTQDSSYFMDGNFTQWIQSLEARGITRFGLTSLVLEGLDVALPSSVFTGLVQKLTELESLKLSTLRFEDLVSLWHRPHNRLLTALSVHQIRLRSLSLTYDSFSHLAGEVQGITAFAAAFDLRGFRVLENLELPTPLCLGGSSLDNRGDSPATGHRHAPRQFIAKDYEGKARLFDKFPKSIRKLSFSDVCLRTNSLQLDMALHELLRHRGEQVPALTCIVAWENRNWETKILPAVPRLPWYSAVSAGDQRITFLTNVGLVEGQDWSAWFS